MKQSIWAVVAGILVIIGVTTLVDIALHTTEVYPEGQPLDDRLSLLATSYRILIGIGGGWLSARLAPRRPLKHALVLGLVGTALGCVGIVATWGQNLGPRWYPIAVAVLAIPQCWVGGKIHELRAGQR
jgi:MFS family permease